MTSEVQFITPAPILHVDPEEQSNINFEVIQPSSTPCPNESIANCQDGGLVVPRDGDRVMEQFVFMLLRVSQYIKSEIGDSYNLFVRTVPTQNQQHNYLHSSTLCTDTTTEGQPDVSRTNAATSSYLTDFPQIFQKKQGASMQLVPQDMTQTQTLNQKNGEERITRYHSVSFSTGKQISIDIEETVSCRTIVEGEMSNELTEFRPHSIKDKVPTVEYSSEPNILKDQPNTSEIARTNKQNKLLKEYKLRVNTGTQKTTGKHKRATNNTPYQPTSSKTNERKQTKSKKDSGKQSKPKPKPDDKNNKNEQNESN